MRLCDIIAIILNYFKILTSFRYQISIYSRGIFAKRVGPFISNPCLLSKLWNLHEAAKERKRCQFHHSASHWANPDYLPQELGPVA